MFTPNQTFLSRRLGLNLAAGLAVSVLACTCTANAQTAAPAKSAATAKAAEPSPYKTPAVKEDNAALEYLTLRDTFDPEFLKLVSEEYNGGEVGWVPSEKLTVMLEEAQPLIKRLITASRMPFCDFGIRYEDGFGALLPHLGHMRTYARVLASDARRLAVAGRTDDAALRLVTCIRMSAQLTLDRVLISSLVSIAINSLAMNQAELIARDYGMSDSMRKQIIVTARGLLTDDPFGTRACIQMEKQLAVNSIKPYYKGKGDEAGRELVKQFKLWQFDTESLKEIAPLNEQQIDEQMDLMDRYYATLTSLWTAKDAEERLKELEERLTKGEFGLLVRHLAPALTKCRASTNKGIKEIKDVTALLEAGMTPPAPEPDPIEEAGE
jgi:hypothetical protein